MKNLRLISIWKAERSQNTDINDHSHAYHELVYYVAGDGETVIGEKKFQFSDHCFALIPPQVEHCETHRAKAEVICLEFAGAENLPLGFCTEPTHAVLPILRTLLDEVKYQKFGYEEMLTIKLNELLLQILRSEKSTANPKTFAHIVNYIQENIHEHINLSDCAKQLNISYDYFQHKFKALMGCSPQQFLMEQRLLTAQKLLAEGKYNCTEIAYRCGFCTSAQFSVLFKKRFGLPPSRFRNLHG